MKTARLTDLYAEQGPFATVMVDVSHDSENGAQSAEGAPSASSCARRLPCAA